MTDNITLPRAVAFEMLEALTCGSSIRHKCQHCGQHIGNFYAALYAALAAPEPEPTVKESLTVDAALAEPDATPKPATDEQIFDAYQSAPDDDFYYGWCAAERFHGIGGSKT